jgi:hypothetical protein
MSFWANILLGKCLLGKCLSGQMSFLANVFWADVFWANVVLSKCLWAYLSGQMSYGKMSGHRSTVHLFQNYEMEAKVDEEPVMKKQNATFTIGQLSNAAM